jgi:S-DNA-T family DNA segregation ATPase FtsK/SpoIIIE
MMEIQMNKPNVKKVTKNDTVDRMDRFLIFLKLAFVDPTLEIYRGFKKNTMPVAICSLAGLLAWIIAYKNIDFYFFKTLSLDFLYPKGSFRAFYLCASVISGYYIFGLIQTGRKLKMLNKLSKVFHNSNLKSPMGDLPKFIDDAPIDDSTRKLRLTSAGIPLSKFKVEKDAIETNLDVEIIKIVNTEGSKSLIDIVYGTFATPHFWHIEDLGKYKDFSFPIGRNQTGEITTSLKDVPHFLVAGLTGGGKSTFTRMMTAVLTFNNDDISVSVLDLKGGMEAQLFEDIKGVRIFSEAKNCQMELLNVRELLDERMKLISSNKCKDIAEYNKKKTDPRDRLDRKLLIVDEASELSLKMGDRDAEDLKQINSSLSKVARMGRACGIHLVIGTQKPDNRNLDATIKANLPGIICFYVTNHTQSNVVLGNRRAADLDGSIRGRAIWQWGSQQQEVQTPYLTPQEVEDAKIAYEEEKDNERITDEEEYEKYKTKNSVKPRM